MSNQTILPEGWRRPRGYSNEVVASGRQVYVGGQVGWNAEGTFVSADLADQTVQTLRNIVDVLAAAGAGPQHIVRMTWYVVDKAAYLASLQVVGEAYRKIIGRHFPAMTAVEVTALIEDEARVEIECTAVVPDSETTA